MRVAWVALMLACCNAPSPLVASDPERETQLKVEEPVPEVGAATMSPPTPWTCKQVWDRVTDLYLECDTMEAEFRNRAGQALRWLPDEAFGYIPATARASVDHACELAGAILSEPGAACEGPKPPFPTPVSKHLLELLSSSDPSFRAALAPVSDAQVEIELKGRPWLGLFKNHRSWDLKGVVMVNEAFVQESLTEQRTLHCESGPVMRSFGLLSVQLTCTAGGAWAPLDRNRSARIEVLRDPAAALTRTFVASPDRLWAHEPPLSLSQAMSLHPEAALLTAPARPLMGAGIVYGLAGEEQERTRSYAVRLNEAWCFNERDEYELCLDGPKGLVGASTLVGGPGKTARLRAGTLVGASLDPPVGATPAPRTRLHTLDLPPLPVACVADEPAFSESTYADCRAWLLAPDGEASGTLTSRGIVLGVRGVGSLQYHLNDLFDLAAMYRTGRWTLAMLANSVPASDRATTTAMAAACERMRAATTVSVAGQSERAAAALLGRFGLVDHGHWEQPQPIAEMLARTALACGARAAKHTPSMLLSSWSGTRCGNQGVVLGDVCVDGTSCCVPFPAYPIDARVPPALSAALSSARTDLAARGIALEGASMIGCFLTRFEGPVRTRAPRVGDLVRPSDVSRHAEGVACDLSRLQIDGKEVTVEDIGKEIMDAARGWGETMFYRRSKLEARPTSRRDRFVTIAIVLRNALVDQGFVVYSPLTNPFHKDHFHFHVHDRLGRADPPLDWEAAIANDLARARGEISIR